MEKITKKLDLRTCGGVSWCVQLLPEPSAPAIGIPQNGFRLDALPVVDDEENVRVFNIFITSKGDPVFVPEFLK